MNLAYRQLRFVTLDGEVAAPGVGNNQAVNFRCNLPQNFAYVILGFTASMATDSAGTSSWTERGLLETQNGGADSTFNWINICQNSGSAQGTNNIQVVGWVAPGLYPGVLVCDQNADGQVKFKTQNETEDDVAYKFNGQVIVNQYTIEQANHYLISTPQFTRTTC